ncbi:MAG: hypothetical protein NT069_14655 [Planctomycetota bacterium]|nr:hypothetical protein [Planctomycetota bacterium]
MSAPRWTELLHTIRDTIVALDLPEISAGNVVVQKVASDRPRDLPPERRPAVLIAPHGAERIDPAAGTNLRDQIVYPVLVAIVAADSPDPSDRFELFSLWRDRLRTTFHFSRFESLDCFRVEVEPLDLVDREVWSQRQLWLSRLLLRCFTRILRD